MIRMFVRHRVANDITLEAAKALASSDVLEQAMVGAGVVGAPDIWFAKAA